MTQQTALVTGASGGIGYAMAGVFASKGYDIIAVGHHAEKLEVAAEIFRMRGVSVISLVKDLTQAQAPQQIYDELRQRNIIVDVLVNNADTGHSGPFHTSDFERNIAIIRLNIEALTCMTRLFVTDMVARGSGKILNLGSLAGFRPGPLRAVYDASKAYVVSFSEAIAEELAGTGVSVTVLCPGPVKNGFFDSADHATGVDNAAVLDAADVARAGFDALMGGERVMIAGSAADTDSSVAAARLQHNTCRM